MQVQQACQSSSRDRGICSPLVFLAGKTSLEKDIIHKIKTNNVLKMLEQKPSVFIYADMPPSKRDVLTFQPEVYFRALSANHFGRILLWSPRLTSTQDFIAQNFNELLLGSVCVADTQCKGRGRVTNVWDSPVGCLMFSFSLQMENGHILPFLQYVVTLAMTEAIGSLCRIKGLPKLFVRIKWPNDVYLDGFKVGGILCTSTYRSKKFNVTVGIGLNMDNEQPTTGLNKVLQQLFSEATLCREEILATFFDQFEDLYEVFIKQGFGALEELYYKSWLHSGQRVIVEESDDKRIGKNVAVTIKGLTSTGYLWAAGDDGTCCELHPDGNSLDFFKGLVKRKHGANKT